MSDSARLQVVIESRNVAGPGLDAFKRQVESLGVSVDQVSIRTNRAGQEIARFVGQAAAPSQGMQVLRQEIERATGASVALTSGLSRGLQGATGEMSKLAQGIGHGLGLFSSFGAGIGTAVVTAAITKAISDTTKAFAQFELQLRGVNALLGQTGEASERSFRSMERDVRQTASSFGVGSTEMTKALYNVVSAGIQPGAQAMQVLNASTTLAIGGLAEMASTTDALTTILNAYHLSASDAARVSDQISEAVNIGKFNMDEFSRSLGVVVPLAAQLGVSFPELAAAVATASQQGVRGATAFEGVRAVLENLLRPSEEARRIIGALAESGKIHADVLTAQGIASRGLLGTLNELNRGLDGNKAALAIVLGDVNAVNFGMAVTGRNAGLAAEGLDRITNSAGKASLALQEVDKSGSRAVDHLRTQFNILQEQFGEVFARGVGLPIVGALAAAADQLDKEGRAIRSILDRIGAAFEGSAAAEQFTASLAEANDRLARGEITAEQHRKVLAALAQTYAQATGALKENLDQHDRHRQGIETDTRATQANAQAQKQSEIDIRAATDALTQLKTLQGQQPQREEQQALKDLRDLLNDREREAQRAAEAEQRRSDAHVRALQGEAERGQEALQHLRDASANARAELQELSRVRVEGTAAQEQRVFDLGTRSAQDQLIIEQARLARLQARQQGLPPPIIDRAAIRAAARDQRVAEQEAKVAELQGRTTLAPQQRAVDLALQPPEERAFRDLFSAAQAAHAAVVKVEGESQSAFERRLREMEEANKRKQKAAQDAAKEAQDEGKVQQDTLQKLRDQNADIIRQAELIANATEQAREKAKITALEALITKGGLSVPEAAGSAAGAIAALGGATPEEAKRIATERAKAAQTAVDAAKAAVPPPPPPPPNSVVNAPTSAVGPNTLTPGEFPNTTPAALRFAGGGVGQATTVTVASGAVQINNPVVDSEERARSLALLTVGTLLESIQTEFDNTPAAASAGARLTGGGG